MTPDPTMSEQGHNPSEAGFVRTFAKNRIALISLLFVIALILVYLFGLHVWHVDPDTQNLKQRLSSPSSDHWFGTDKYGRDQLNRMIQGTGVSLYAASLAVVVGFVIGVPAGLTAGFFGGFYDQVLSRFFDGIFALPALIVAITVIAIVGPGLTNAMVTVGVIFSPGFFRVARASTRNLVGETFVEASRSIGCSTRRILWVHILPNALSPVVVQTTVSIGMAIIAEASLSFLGFGVQAPTASWGGMLGAGFPDMVGAAYLVYIPGLAITATVLAFTQIGEGLRTSLGVERNR